MQRQRARIGVAPSSSGCWWDRYVSEVGGKVAAATLNRAGKLGGASDGWWRQFRKTSDADSHGEKHRGRFELVIWEGWDHRRKLGFASRPVGREADTEKERFNRDFVGSHDIDDDALLGYFRDCVLSSRFEGTEAIRWTCCGHSHAEGSSCRDHHRLGCRCDHC
jgi:hypothetical protein